MYLKTTICVAMAACMLSGAAAATPLLLDFDFDSTGYGTVIAQARAAGIDIDETNYGLYGYRGNVLTLGNDGLSNTAGIRAEPGKLFDVRSIDIDEVFSDLTLVSCNGLDTVSLSFDPSVSLDCDDPAVGFLMDSVPELPAPVELAPRLIFDGRSGTSGDRVTATALLDGRGTIDVAALGDFTGLDSFTMSIIAAGPSGLPTFSTAFDGWIDCLPRFGSAGCGLVFIDSMSLDVRPDTQPSLPAVPLPAGAGLLIGALAALGAVRRRGRAALRPR